MKKTIIKFEQFGFKYRTQAQPTLKNIELTIYEGEKVLIVGPSGSGKSTIGHCLNGLVPFSYKGETEGSLEIKGKEVNSQALFERSGLVGTVLQDSDGQFIGLSVGEDIAFSLENNATEQEEMQRRVEGVAELIEMEPYLSHSVKELSGGQKQRVALGGVMVNEVDILLFDEPLANLDPAAGKYAVTLIDDIQKESNKTVIIIEHRLEDVLYRHVDRIIVMNAGEIVADLPPNELLATSILEKTNIREPLYLKALKYAGCTITPTMKPEHIDTIELKACKEHLRNWFQSRPEGVVHVKQKPVLEIEDLTFSYDRNKPVLINLTFSLQKGEMVSIVGENGAGKSTLSSVLCGFEKPISGEMRVNGLAMTDDTIKERAKRIGLVLQNPNQMISKHYIYDEVALGLYVRGFKEEEIKERVDKVLKVCGLYPFRNWPISALSYGQKKRVTIASMLVLEPEILILDEPTAGQDYYHYTEVMEFLVELNKRGVIVVIITHDMHLMLEYTSRSIVLNEGRVLMDAPPEEVLTNPAVIKKASLKETSLYELALKSGISDPTEFVRRFIAHERKEGRKWR
ncbi:ABC transporter ATP-binding protein [Bacillus spongiae]|uniref:ABC transporter ATP-binding protein n=1 Tax=Bacillus spongiae TaxID=2683610 RepID=A0ABU8H8C0_9BACI